MARIGLAFRSFFALLTGDTLPDSVITELGLSKRGGAASKAPAAAVTGPTPADGALQLLGILQREGRLLDFFMEDVAAYSDDQIGAAVRDVHAKCREALNKYVKLEPVVDGVEGTYTAIAGTDAAAVKLVGNVPPERPAGGMLRHKGWRAKGTSLPTLGSKANTAILAPAEVEIE